MGDEYFTVSNKDGGGIMPVPQVARLHDPSSLRKTVILLAWPAIVEMLLHMMVGIVDTAMVGRLGPTALASVGLANQIFFLGTTVFAAIATGATSLVARHIGAKEPEQAGHIARQSLLMGFCFAGLITVTFLLSAQNIVALLFRQLEPEVLHFSSLYVRIISLALILHFFMILVNAVLRGAGDTKTPMRLTGIVNAVNVIGNYFLIFGVGPFPALGVQGAAIATAFAQGLGGLIAIYVLTANPTLRVSLVLPFTVDLVAIRRILRIGVPAALEQSTMRVGQLFYTMIVASLGTIPYAAHQVALNAESLSFMPGFGFSLAATTLVGQNLGAKDPDRAERSGFMANQMAMLVMSVMGVVFFFFPDQLVSIFTSDPEVIALARVCLRLIALTQPFLATIMVLAGGLRGAGDTKSILKISLYGFLGIRVVLAYLFTIVLGYGLVGAWVAMAIDLVVRGVLMRLRYGSGQWKTLKI